MAVSAGSVALKPAQERVLAALQDEEYEEITRAEYEELGGVSRSQAAYDLADLVHSGLLERVGLGRSTRYRLAQTRTGRTRKWTEERIRAELESFCSGREEWPGASEFRRTGRGDLYLAASRYGGIDFWSSELGLREPVEAPGPSLAHRLALVGVATAAVLVAVAAGSMVGLGWQAVFGGGQESSAPESLRPRPASLEEAPAGKTALETASDRKATATPAVARLALRARSGDSWLEVRRNSANGRVLYRGRLDAGDARRFEGKRLWLRLGEPASLRARLNGRPLALPSRTSTAILTAGGLTVFVPRESSGSPPAVPVSSTQTAPPPSSAPAPATSPSPSSPAPDAVAPGGPAPDPPPAQR